MFGFGSGSGLVQMIAIKRCIEHFGLSRAIFFANKNVFVIARNFGKKRALSLASAQQLFLASVFSTFFNIF
jgi:hypothetical protein